MVEFIQFKTLSMDLESILSNVTRMYVNSNDYNMAELIALSEAELYPVGSYDEKAERYEYVLKLSVPVKYFDHLRDNIDPIRRRISDDLTLITAPYIHELISEVFIVIKIEQDSQWRSSVLEYVAEAQLTSGTAECDCMLFFASPDSGGIVVEMEKRLIDKGIKAVMTPLSSISKKELHSVLRNFEKTSRFGIFLISKAFLELSLPAEVINEIAWNIINPAKNFYQLWDMVSRTDVAAFSSVLARSLACSTERMSVESICENILI